VLIHRSTREVRTRAHHPGRRGRPRAASRSGRGHRPRDPIVCTGSTPEELERSACGRARVAWLLRLHLPRTGDARRARWGEAADRVQRETKTAGNGTSSLGVHDEVFDGDRRPRHPERSRAPRRALRRHQSNRVGASMPVFFRTGAARKSRHSSQASHYVYTPTSHERTMMPKGICSSPGSATDGANHDDFNP